MIVYLHDYPGDKQKREYKLQNFQFKIIVPVIIQTKEIYSACDYVFQVAWHDGEHYHYKPVGDEE